MSTSFIGHLPCAIGYCAEGANPWPVSSTGSHPVPSKNSTDGMKGLGRSIYFAFRGKIHSVNFDIFHAVKKWRNAVDLRHLPEGTHSLAHRPGSLVRLAFQKWSAWGDLHSQGRSGLSRTGLLFPANHTPVGDPGLAPGRLGDFKLPGSLTN